MLNLKDNRPLYNIGYLYYDLKKYELAIVYFDSALVLNNRHSKTFYWMANSYAKLEKEQKALNYFNSAIDLIVLITIILGIEV